MDDFSALDKTRHMLEWLFPVEDPYAELKQSLNDLLSSQVPDQEIKVFKVTGAPDWLTSVKPASDDLKKSVLSRSAVAIPIRVVMHSAQPSSKEKHSTKETYSTTDLSGIYTWAGVGLDQPHAAQFRQWLDIDGTLDEFGSDARLKDRIFFEMDTQAQTETET